MSIVTATTVNVTTSDWETPARMEGQLSWTPPAPRRVVETYTDVVRWAIYDDRLQIEQADTWTEYAKDAWFKVEEEDG